MNKLKKQFEPGPHGTDGRNANVQGQQFLALHFEVTATAGEDNTLPHPIYLPPLAMNSAKVVGGNQDVVITLPGYDGFKMTVKANSVTFPDGSRQGTLVVSPVNADKLPMTPPGGGATFTAPAWTIQPSGTRFDPPIQVQMPNNAQLQPGETQPIYQWDHDLATFVGIGRGTVSEDGALVFTDHGSGITKAGWGGGSNGPPPPPTCVTTNCKICEKKNDGKAPCCVFDNSKDQKPLYVSNVALSTEPIKGLLDRLFKVADAAGEFTVKLDGAVAGRAEKICCALKKKEANKVSLVGQIKLEQQSKVNLIPLLGRVQRWLPRDLKDATDAGIYFLMRGGLSGSGALSYDACKSSRGSDNVLIAGFGNGAVSARIAWPPFTVAGVEIVPSAELNLGEVGITGGLKADLSMVSESSAIGPTESYVYSYFKGDLRVGTLKITAWDFQVSLIEPTPGRVSVPIGDF
jgi:hypothetical protein